MAFKGGLTSPSIRKDSTIHFKVIHDAELKQLTIRATLCIRIFYVLQFLL